MRKGIINKLPDLKKWPVVLVLAVLVVGCSTSPISKEYKNVNSFNHPDVANDEKVIFIVGVEGPNPLSFVRICTEDFKERVGKWTDHRLKHSVQPGEVFVIEQPNFFPVRRLCAYSKDRYENYVGTHIISEIVHPGETGAGIYYLGTVKTPDSVSAFKLSELYYNEATDTVKEELSKAVNMYPGLKPINFDI